LTSSAVAQSVSTLGARSGAGPRENADQSVHGGIDKPRIRAETIAPLGSPHANEVITGIPGPADIGRKAESARRDPARQRLIESRK
jgi:hypothetical protein